MRIILWGLFSLTAVGWQQQDIIYWSAGRKLVLSDFKVVDDDSPLMRKEAAAITRTGITYSMNASRSSRSSTVTLEVFATVHRSHTYIRKSRLQMEPERIRYLLNHEQKHFDISEIFAREATRDLVRKNATKNYQQELADLVKARFKEAEAFQKRYDAATNNGRDAQRQAIWDGIISRRLKSLEAYRNKKVIKKIVF
ncbi:DUF922 domain-containing protein [Niabella terrae]